MVQIEFEMDEKNILLSDFDEWHCVLNDDFISDNEAQNDWFYNSYHVDSEKIKRNTWQKIFDLSRDFPDWTTTIKNKSTQATMWEIQWSQVKRVEYFIAK